VTLISLLLLAACGSAPPRQPVAMEQAKKADQAAHRALRDGDLMRARELFRQSLLLQQSLDDRPASAMAAINLSSVAHKLGMMCSLGLLDHVLSDAAPPYPAELRGTAFRKAIILWIQASQPRLRLPCKVLPGVQQQCTYAQG
jgi:hypothetical protein